jgi:hypothetical protein
MLLTAPLAVIVRILIMTMKARRSLLAAVTIKDLL